MPVTEKLMSQGSFSINLKSDTPRYFVDTYTGERIQGGFEQDPAAPVTSFPNFWMNDLTAFNHIIVTDLQLDPNRDHRNLDRDELLAASRYTGRIESVSDNGLLIEGSGLISWLGDDDGKGPLLETVAAGEYLTYTQWIELLLPATGMPLKRGTIHGSLSGETFSWASIYETRRDALQRVNDYFGCEWKVRPDGYIDFGPPSSLFQENPTVIVSRDPGTPETNIHGLATEDLSYKINYKEFVNKVIGVGQAFNYDVAIAEASLRNHQQTDLWGEAVNITKAIDISDITSDEHMEGLCYSELARSSVQESINLSTDTYAIPKHVAVGDWIWVWDPSHIGLFMVGAADPGEAQIIMYRGIPTRPKKLRVYGYTWPIEQGMGVYRIYSPPGGADPIIHDITPYVEFEDPGQQIDPEAIARQDKNDLLIPPVELLPPGPPL